MNYIFTLLTLLLLTSNAKADRTLLKPYNDFCYVKAGVVTELVKDDVQEYVNYTSPEYGFSVMFPYSKNWGTTSYSIPPFVADGRRISFGPLGTGEGGAYCQYLIFSVAKDSRTKSALLHDLEISAKSQLDEIGIPQKISVEQIGQYEIIRNSGVGVFSEEYLHIFGNKNRFILSGMRMLPKKEIEKFIVSINESFIFQDIPTSHPNFAAITYVKDQGIVNGYPDNTYRPANLINRAEFTKIVIGAVDDQVQTQLDCDPGAPLSDVEPGSWYEEICAHRSVFEPY